MFYTPPDILPNAMKHIKRDEFSLPDVFLRVQPTAVGYEVETILSIALKVHERITILWLMWLKWLCLYAKQYF